MDARTLAICTGARIDRARTHLAALDDAMHEFDISTPVRQAAFLPQIGHESGGLRWLVELWNPTPAQRRYEGREDLGNTEKGDGFRYRGRGWMQLTGRANYREYGDLLGVDLEQWPEQAAEPAVAARVAGLYWARHGCNELADEGDFEQITREINGGLNGYEHRCELWEAAKQELGV